ncbi:MAG: D-2-hydroxyacid dehydrogenase [Peptococcaceae bacterium]|jgi:phosphoglycerate dehydrogenase-like enzyme|nr:D-2-hydroxyacid dehydrogenase [Peptococcaceae bacterium]
MNLLIITNNAFALGEEELALLQKEAPDLAARQIDIRQVTDDDLREAEVIYGWPNAKKLKAAVNLRWLHTPSAGIDAYADPSVFADPDVVVTRSKDVFNVQIAEHVIMLFLALNRDLAASVRSTMTGQWTRISDQKELSGATVLIVGAGAIGNELAKQLQGFSCHVVGIKRDPSVKPLHYNEVYADSEMDAHLPEADYVALCLPRTPGTIGMFDYRRFSLMKKSAIISNIGRGDAIVSDDLDRALREKLLFGAGLDVTEPEPLPEGHPLWSAPNIIITSHTSGFSVNANKRRFGVFYDLWKRYNAGLPLHSIVDFTKGY